MFGGKKIIRSKNLAAKKKKEFIFKITLWSVFVFVLIYGMIVLVSQPFLKIKNIVVKNNITLDSAEIENIVKDTLSGNYLWFLPKDSIVLYPRKNIEKKLAENFSRIKKVAVSNEGLNTLQILIDEYDPIALWCRGDLEINSSAGENNGSNTLSETDKAIIVPSLNYENYKISQNDSCYFIDLSGFIFSEAPNFSNDVYTKYYGIVSRDNPIGSFYLDFQTFNDLRVFVDNIKKLDMSISAVISRGDGDYEIRTVSNGIIIFNMRIPLEQTFENLQVFLDDKTIFPMDSRSHSSIVHIDLRSGEKILYQLK